MKSEFDLTDYVRKSTKNSGVPVRVSNADVLRTVVALLVR